MLIKVTVLAEAHGPSERIVGIKTAAGKFEQMPVSKRILTNPDAAMNDETSLQVGRPLAFENENVLIELPRESASGRWRIWVPESETIEQLQAAE